MPQIVLDVAAIKSAMEARDWSTPQLYEAMQGLGYEGSEKGLYHALSGYVQAPAPSLLWYAARALGCAVDDILTERESTRTRKPR